MACAMFLIPTQPPGDHCITPGACASFRGHSLDVVVKLEQQSGCHLPMSAALVVAGEPKHMVSRHETKQPWLICSGPWLVPVALAG
jgi:hypothetical protein